MDGLLLFSLISTIIVSTIAIILLYKIPISSFSNKDGQDSHMQTSSELKQFKIVKNILIIIIFLIFIIILLNLLKNKIFRVEILSIINILLSFILLILAIIGIIYTRLMNNILESKQYLDKLSDKNFKLYNSNIVTIYFLTYVAFSFGIISSLICGGLGIVYFI